MLRLESLLFDDPKSNKYSFGFEKSESLYAKVLSKEMDPITGEYKIRMDRTQNNVFPVFWYRNYSNSNERKTLLYRY